MDANAKRNARRKKILANSGSRLMKITGRSCLENSQVESSPELIQSTPVTLQRHTENSVNGIVVDNYNELSDTEVFKSEDTWNGLISPRSYRPNDISSRTDSVPNITSKDLNSQAFSGHGQPYQDYSKETNTIDCCTTNLVKRTPLWSLITSRVVYIPLALIVNLLLIWRLDYLFGKTIIIPWFTIVLIRLYGHKNMYDSQEGSLLFVALILCNIKPDLTHRLKVIVTVVSVVIGDLALYIFSFTLIHFAISLCLQDTNILLTTDV